MHIENSNVFHLVLDQMESQRYQISGKDNSTNIGVHWRISKVVYVTGGVRWRTMRERNRHTWMYVDQQRIALEVGGYSIVSIYLTSNRCLRTH